MGEELRTGELSDIDIETYSVIVAPSENTAIVEKEKESLLGVVDLKALVEDLGRVGSFIRVAYNGVGAAGPEYTEVQIDVQRLGYDTTKLSDKSAITIAKFKSASEMVITEIQSAYGYLLDGLDELAVETMANIKEVAKGMQKAANELHVDFNEQTGKVIVTLESTQRAKKDGYIKINDLKKKRAELEQKQKRANEKAAEAEAKIKEAESKEKEYELKEDESIKQLGNPNLLFTVVNALTTFAGVGPVVNEEDPKAKANAFKEKRIEALKLRNEAQKEKSDRLDEMASFAATLTSLDTGSNMAKIVVDALHQAIGALSSFLSSRCKLLTFGSKWKNIVTLYRKIN